MHKLAMIIATIFSMSAPHVTAIDHSGTMVVTPLGTPKNVRTSKALHLRFSADAGASALFAGAKGALSATDGISVVSLHHLAGKWTKDVLHAARKAHISPRLVASVLHVENRGEINESAHRVSSAGAIGPMQLMPTTAWDDLHVNPWNPKENINGGARYLAGLLRRFGGNRRLALIAYNAGPSAVADGARPECAVLYADTVLRYAG